MQTREEGREGRRRREEKKEQEGDEWKMRRVERRGGMKRGRLHIIESIHKIRNQR